MNRSESKRSEERESQTRAAADETGAVGVSYPNPTPPFFLSLRPAGLTVTATDKMKTFRQSKGCASALPETPSPLDVQKLLKSYNRTEIEEAFRDYCYGKNDNDMQWAEKVFFADGGAHGVILCCPTERVGRSLDTWAKSIFDEQTIEEWLADNSIPPGLSDGDILIRDARKTKQKLVADWNTGNPPCSKCKSQGFPQVGGVCKKCPIFPAQISLEKKL